MITAKTFPLIVLASYYLVCSWAIGGTATQPELGTPPGSGAPAGGQVKLLKDPDQPRWRWAYIGWYKRACKSISQDCLPEVLRFGLADGRRALVLGETTVVHREFIVLIYRNDAKARDDHGEFQVDEAWLWNGPEDRRESDAALAKYLSLSTDERRRADRSNELSGAAFVREKDGIPDRFRFEKLVSVKPLADEVLDPKVVEACHKALADAEKRIDPADKETLEELRDEFAMYESCSGPKAAVIAWRDRMKARMHDLEKILASDPGNTRAKTRLEAFKKAIPEVDRRLAKWDDHVTFSDCNIKGRWGIKIHWGFISL